MVSQTYQRFLKASSLIIIMVTVVNVVEMWTLRLEMNSFTEASSIMRTGSDKPYGWVRTGPLKYQLDHINGPSVDQLIRYIRGLKSQRIQQIKLSEGQMIIGFKKDPKQ